jgi:hypothetical protein
MGNVQAFYLENLCEKYYLGDIDVDGKIILECILRKWDMRA